MRLERLKRPVVHSKPMHIEKVMDRQAVHGRVLGHAVAAPSNSKDEAKARRRHLRRRAHRSATQQLSVRRALRVGGAVRVRKVPGA
jgi:hypothetical protein